MTTLLLCLSLLIAAMQYSTVDSALPCNSPLRRYLPQQFTHCPSCSYGPWGPWRSSIPVQVRTDHTCDSRKARKTERSRTALSGTTCTPSTVKEYKYECKELHYNKQLLVGSQGIPFTCLLASLNTGEPTLRQKAVLIIQSLRLGVDANTSPTKFQTRPPTRVTSPPVYGRRGGTYKTCPDGTRILATQTCSRNNYCPTASRQANNRICPNICSRRGTYALYACTMYVLWA